MGFEKWVKGDSEDVDHKRLLTGEFGHSLLGDMCVEFVLHSRVG